MLQQLKKLLCLPKRQLTLFFYALSYFTRLPIPVSTVFDNEQFHKANAYLPLIGMLVAFVMLITFYFCQLLFSLPISIILMLVVSLLLTGALHEDGFADCCDGFGGGYDATQRLKIMKDSQIGSYAGIGLVVLFLLKFNILIELATIGFETFAISLLIAHTLSRYGALCIMQTMPYVRLAKEGKVKGLAKKLNCRYFLFASLSVLPVLFLTSITSVLFIVIASLLCTLLLMALFKRNLEGYTGDCLGLTQQSLELVILLLSTLVLAT